MGFFSNRTKEEKEAKELRVFNIDVNTDPEYLFLRSKLLEKWDDIFQRKTIIDELKFFENDRVTKRFVAESFSIELTGGSDFVYESQGKKLFFNFEAKPNGAFVLCLEYETDQEAENLKTVSVGTPNRLAKYHDIYGFLCSLGYPEIADHMDVFFTRLEEVEQKLPNKGLEDKYSSALDSLSTL